MFKISTLLNYSSDGLFIPPKSLLSKAFFEFDIIRCHSFMKMSGCFFRLRNAAVAPGLVFGDIVVYYMEGYFALVGGVVDG